MKRLCETFLDEWKHDTGRQVLLIRGARQVGKTFAVRSHASSYEHFIEVNFEQSRQVRSFFSGDLDITTICRNLAAFYKKPVIDGKTLLFFDEIQACPDALQSLRFFYEERPGLHLIAAGSLLEFALQNITSFGVGRIRSLYLYPLSFREFLMALEEDELWDLIVEAAHSARPVDAVFHDRLLDYLRVFQLIGGMPAVVDRYRATNDLAVCQNMLDDLLRTLRDDFAKYAARLPVAKLSDVFYSVAYQAGGKFMYARAAQDTSIVSYKTALELLVQAGLVYKIHHTSARGIPLGAQIDERKFKAILLDTGIHQRLLGLELGEYLSQNRTAMINDGHLAEAFAGIAMIAGMSPRTSASLYYWHREAKASNAEIDYVISRGSSIIPVEVKSQSRGSMKSMHLFLAEGRARGGIRLSHENFSACGEIIVIPLYAAELIPSLSPDPAP
ncbi:MAG: ATP-binding protein [Chitinispirillaceae bacterium]|nr:ATP-binding protein [Chitinispirillaceae bacterium]